MPVSTAATAMYSTVQIDQRGDDPDRDVPLRVRGLLGVRGDRVEADVGEEDHRRPGQHAQRLAAGPVWPRRVLPKKLSPVQPKGAKGCQLAGST